MEEKNPDNHIDEAPGAISDTRGPAVEKRRRDYDHVAEKVAPTHANVNMSVIQLKTEDLYDKDKVAIGVEDIFQLLQCDDKGLTDEEARRRIELFGPNKLEEKHVNPFLQFLSFMWNPLSWVMEAAALVAIVLSNGRGSPPDWEDFCGIITLLFVNASIGFYEEHNAGNAVKALMDSLALKANVKRDGKWIEIKAFQAT